MNSGPLVLAVQVLYTVPIMQKMTASHLTNCSRCLYGENKDTLECDGTLR